MKFETYLPCDMLKPYVKHFIISENSDAQTYKVLPGTALVMGFQYTGKLSHVKNNTDIPLATSGITGLIDSYRTFKNAAGIGSVLVMFHETGAAHFFKQPLHELFGESLSLDHFFDKSLIAETEEKLCQAGNDRQRITVIEHLLTSHLQPYEQDMLVHKALNLIHKTNGNIRISELARQLNTSQSPLEKRFRKLVGATPKKFASIMRAKNVMSVLKQSNYQQAIFLAGYYDQAHLIKDFKNFTGTTPEEYIKALNQPL